MGQTAHLAHRQPGRRRPSGSTRPAALAVAAALGAGLLTACGGSSAGARTVLSTPVHVTVTDAVGHSEAVRDGERLQIGWIVQTGSGGSATLNTAGRHVYLLAGSAWQVGDGIHGVLRSGAALVDDRHGPALHLRAGELFLRIPRGSAARVESGYGVRVGTFN